MTTAFGLLAIEDCSAGAGSCRGNCGSAACSTNSYMLAYSHYTECGSIQCSPQSGQPKLAVSCGGSLKVDSYCSAPQTTGRVWDCGPTAVSRTNCHFSCWVAPLSCTQPIIGCGSTGLLTHMMNGGNPTVWGVVAGYLTD